MYWIDDFWSRNLTFFFRRWISSWKTNFLTSQRRLSWSNWRSINSNRSKNRFLVNASLFFVFLVAFVKSMTSDASFIVMTSIRNATMSLKNSSFSNMFWWIELQKWSKRSKSNRLAKEIVWLKFRSFYNVNVNISIINCHFLMLTLRKFDLECLNWRNVAMLQCNDHHLSNVYVFESLNAAWMSSCLKIATHSYRNQTWYFYIYIIWLRANIRTRKYNDWFEFHEINCNCC